MPARLAPVSRACKSKDHRLFPKKAFVDDPGDIGGGRWAFRVLLARSCQNDD